MHYKKNLIEISIRRTKEIEVVCGRVCGCGAVVVHVTFVLILLSIGASDKIDIVTLQKLNEQIGQLPEEMEVEEISDYNSAGAGNDVAAESNNGN